MPDEKKHSDSTRHARDLRAVLWTYIRRHLPQDPPPSHAEANGTEQAKPSRTLRLLSRLPLVLSALFLVSFVWDFQGIVVGVLGRQLSLEGLLLAISVSGFIGFCTNWLAITMLFRPRIRRPLLGQGVIPAQRDRIIERLADAVSEQLISEKVIKERIERSGVVARYRDFAIQVTTNVVADPDFRSELKSLTGGYITGVLESEPVQAKLIDVALQNLDDFSGSKLEEFALKTYRKVKGDRLQQLIADVVHSLPDSVDAMVEHFDRLLDKVPRQLTEKSDSIEQWACDAVLRFVRMLDTRTMIQENLHSYDERQLESLIQESTDNQLDYIKYLGGALGIVGGLVIFDKWLAIPFLAVLVTGILLLDVIFYRLAKL